MTSFPEMLILWAGEKFRNFLSDESGAWGTWDSLWNPGLGQVKEMGKGPVGRDMA